MAEALRPPGFSGGNNFPPRPPQEQPQQQPAPAQQGEQHSILDPSKYPPGVQPVQIFPLSQVTEEMWDRFMAGRLGDVAIECPKGSIIPVFFKFNTTIFSLVDEPKDPLKLQVDRTFYVRFPGGDFLFSFDTVEWLGFPHFFKGHLHTDLDVERGGPEIGLEFDLAN